MNKDYSALKSSEPPGLSYRIGRLLEEYPLPKLTPSEIAHLLPKIAALIGNPTSLAEFCDEGYVRKSLCLKSHYEVLMICWQDGQHSVIHDHAQSNCGFIVLQGQATERFFLKNDHSFLEPAGSRKLEAGSTSISEREEGIHQIINLPGNAPLITLHLYSAPLGPINVYSLEKKTVEQKQLL